MAEQALFSPRKVAFLCIKHCLYEGWDLQASLDKVLINKNLTPKDKSLATELAYGYLRFKIRLDYILAKFLRAPGKLPRDMNIALGLAAYELIFLDRVPCYASVDYWVGHIKKEFPKLTKLANAVLRKVAENKLEFEKIDFYLPNSPSNIAFLSRYYSCPQWIIQLLRKSYTEDQVVHVLNAGLRPPHVGLRFNMHNPEFESALSFFARLPEFLLCQRPGLAFRKTPDQGLAEKIEQGLLSRQSISAQKALLDLKPEQWPGPIWDACAGKGGKTCFLIEMGLGPVWVSDLSLNRLKICSQELKRLGLKKPPLFKADLCRELPLARAPGTILLDVPCSGLGVLSRRPDSKYRRTKTDCKVLIKKQSQMLEKAYAGIKPGGLVVYLTCTLNKAENQEQIQSFLNRHPRAELKTEQTTPLKMPWLEFFYSAKIQKKD